MKKKIKDKNQKHYMCSLCKGNGSYYVFELKDFVFCDKCKGIGYVRETIH